MNGIIHVCSHPEDDNPHFRITEEKIFADIFHYIEVWLLFLLYLLVCCVCCCAVWKLHSLDSLYCYIL